MNRTSLRLFWLPICLCALAITACKSKSVESIYSVESTYETTIREVGITIGSQHKYRLGTLIPNAPKLYMGPVITEHTNSSTLTWTTSEGEQKSSRFQITKSELTDPRVLVLVIHPDETITKEWQTP